MKGQLRDISIYTQIGLLPNIINANNRIIANEFDNIFDASNNTLIKSVDASKGKVTAHWGEFVNLSVDRLTVKDTSSSFSNILENVNHNSLGKRFFSDFLPEERATDDYYAHDINMIKGLAKSLATINASLATLWESLSIKAPNGGQYNDSLTGTVLDASAKYSSSDYQSSSEYYYPVDSSTVYSYGASSPSLAVRAMQFGIDPSTLEEIENAGSYSFSKLIDNEYVNVFSSDVVKYSYPAEYYGYSLQTLKKKVSVLSDIYDIREGMKYNYVNVVSNYVKIDNTKPFSLSLSHVGEVVNLLLDKKDESNDFIVKLSSHPYEHLHIKASDWRTAKVELICVSISNDYGPVFDLYKYSGSVSIV